MKKPTFQIPSISESLYNDFKNGNLTIQQVAEELYTANLTPYVSIEFANRKMQEVEKKRNQFN